VDGDRQRRQVHGDAHTVLGGPLPQEVSTQTCPPEQSAFVVQGLPLP
jgi:hypothetical protein